MDFTNIEITKGFLTFCFGCGGAVLIFIFLMVYLGVSASKSKKLLKKFDKED